MASFSYFDGQSYSATGSMPIDYSGTYNGPNKNYTFSISVDPKFTMAFLDNNTDSRVNGVLVGDSESVVSFYVDLSDNIQSVNISGGNYGDVLIGGSGNDTINGGGGDDVLEGGTGNNTINGGAGNNTASYADYQGFDAQGVTVNLQTGVATDRVSASSSRSAVIARSPLHDTLTNIQNVIGSAYDDILIGNTQQVGSTGNTGTSLSGGGGDDILRIQGTPTLVDGGTGTDTLSVTMSTATLTDANFKNIERVVVYGGGGVDMSGVSAGNAPAQIRSQSTVNTQAVIVGTQGADSIYAGKGNDSLTGGLGNDRLYGSSGNSTFNGSGGGDGNDVMFAGSGTETFNELMAGFGRDLIYKADLSTDYVNVAGLGSDFQMIAINGGKDTLIYNGDVGHKAGADQLVLKGISLADADAAKANGHIFGLQSS